MHLLVKKYFIGSLAGGIEVHDNLPQQILIFRRGKAVATTSST
ncbi:hypothetical protein N2599_26120 (plasmid) [Rhizobium sullae]|uniref:Uncharacterized protein n=1 Tax=Rhizobium sullae TaxID=50338 RepID=A0ABY5XWR5_RHISU|nr:hypothetical protein [Rhizobium sullae]UWU18676.1 hypothetical protein N2599_26120 [Rhizobium sullae]